ncbi:hypothetical protein TanjilG_21321 [Lupinus angustifolius]|uniref:Uncharacterized protein n=2 Tax=Lupinus angustifolius TaxID=3871 RepID=A0A4P1RMT3_LUPAN|nr:hypothetical protein TanjilG_21321 [Lupinus angustifolius]
MSKQDFSDPLSFDHVSNVDDWTGAKDLYEEEYSSNEMALDPASVNTMLLRPLNDEAEELGEGFDDHEIFSCMKDGEDESTRDKPVNH